MKLRRTARREARRAICGRCLHARAIHQHRRAERPRQRAAAAASRARTTGLTSRGRDEGHGSLERVVLLHPDAYRNVVRVALDDHRDGAAELQQEVLGAVVEDWRAAQGRDTLARSAPLSEPSRAWRGPRTEAPSLGHQRRIPVEQHAAIHAHARLVLRARSAPGAGRAAAAVSGAWARNDLNGRISIVRRTRYPLRVRKQASRACIAMGDLVLVMQNHSCERARQYFRTRARTARGCQRPRLPRSPRPLAPQLLRHGDSRGRRDPDPGIRAVQCRAGLRAVHLSALQGPAQAPRRDHLLQNVRTAVQRHGTAERARADCPARPAPAACSTSSSSCRPPSPPPCCGPRTSKSTSSSSSGRTSAPSRRSSRRPRRWVRARGGACGARGRVDVARAHPRRR